jgi:hypothetical protein
VGLKDDAFLAEGEQLVHFFDGKLLSNERAAVLHIVEGDVHHWHLLVYVFVVGAALGKVIRFTIGFANISELVLVERAAHHNSAHLEILVVLLVEIPLLATCFLPKEVDINDFFHLFLAFLLLFGRLQTVVVVDSVLVYVFAEGIFAVLAEEVSFELVLLASHLKSSIRERSYYLML